MSSIITTDAAVTLLSELVRCPSINATGQAEVVPPYGETRLAELLTTKVLAMGGSAEIRPFADGQVNFVGQFAGRDPSRSLLFEAHADTVAVDGMTIDPFDPVVADGKLFGRGSCDTKGPMAAMLLAIAEVIAVDGELPVTMYFAATGDEELGGTGAVSLMDQGFRPDAAIVGEPTGLEIVHASKGAVRFAIETIGRSAHSSTPEKGVNAIYQMARILAAIEQDVAPSLAERRHPLLGAPTVSVGVITGGTQTNVVPERCLIHVDRRLIPGETIAAACDEMNAALEALRPANPELNFTCRKTQSFPPFDTPTDTSVAQLARRACEAVLGQSTFTGAPWSSNAGIFADAGVPSVLFGPGSIAQAHTCDEFIEIEQILSAANVYAAMIREFGQLAAD